MWLAIDTSTENLGVALFSENEEECDVFSQRVWRDQSTRLHPQISAMLDVKGMDVADLMGVVVCKGPGSFTGVRLGMAAAKGLAEAENLPLVGVSGAAAVAYPHRGQGLPVVVWVEANAGDVYTQTFHHDGSEATELRVQSTEAAVADLPANAIIVGNGVAARAEEIADTYTVPEKAGDLTARYVDPLVLAHLGVELLNRGAGAETMDPLYIRPLTYRKSNPLPASEDA